jgi:hypothetical protein
MGVAAEFGADAVKDESNRNRGRFVVWVGEGG